MLVTDIIRAKRDGDALDEAALARIVSGLADSSIPAEQISALAMAIFLNGMSSAEAGTLTRLMAASGTMLRWDADRLGGPVVDKHSTGGVGDKTSFLLAPLAAACGCFVPMISGRGLGHTGGTLDKIDSIPGYVSTPDLDLFRCVVADVGCAIIGQTADLAPADRRFYAIRDVTATVESIPLITASILSKKIAAGNQALVMDVKTGSGAFMATPDKAEALANSLIATAAAAGLPVRALITDMNAPLGTMIGNALEIRECVAWLAGGPREARLDEVTMGLAVEMLLAGGIESDPAAARARLEKARDSGRAAEVFGRMVAALGGPADFLERHEAYLPRAPVTLPVPAREAGWLAEVDSRAVGQAVIALGGGRQTIDDVLDLSVGFADFAAPGSRLEAGDPLAVVHAASEDAARRAAASLLDAVRIAPDRPVLPPTIHKALAGS